MKAFRDKVQALLTAKHSSGMRERKRPWMAWKNSDILNGISRSLYKKSLSLSFRISSLLFSGGSFSELLMAPSIRQQLMEKLHLIKET